MFTTILYALAGAGLVASFLKDRAKTKKALMKAWKSFENILPQLLSILVIIGIALAVLNPRVISDLIGSGSGFPGVAMAALVGAIALIPGFVAFPLAAALLEGGAGYMQIGALVSTLMMVGVLTIPLEIKIMGKKAALIRNVLAFLFSFAVAGVIGWVLV